MALQSFIIWNGFSCLLIACGSSIYNGALQRQEAVAFAPREVCMKELGCFGITDDFKSFKRRPINVLPNDRATINTRCLLYTRKNAKESHQLIARDKSTFTESNFNSTFPTKFIVHGFMDSELYGPWMLRMKDEFLLLGDNNVIVVDWSGGNKLPYYQATANTRVVAAEVALVIQALEKFTGAKSEEIHIIGHSLGAHIAGYIGKRLKTLGRITGCDPAEPYFQNMPATVRLDSTDANFVDIIHSDSTDYMLFGFGMSQTIGHIDFFPNNGVNQPGCRTDKFKTFLTEGLMEGFRRFGACNHQRSLDFMHHSINYLKITPVAFECSGWKEFLEGKCSSCGKDGKRCAIMGIKADHYKKFKNSSITHKMYLKTSDRSPFWLYHYQLNVKLYKPSVSYKDVEGNLDIGLIGSKSDEIFHVETRKVSFFHGSRYQYLVTTEKELGEIKSVSMKWMSSSKNPIDYFKKPLMYIEYITLVPMNAIELSPRKMSGRIFCGNPQNGITSNTIATLHRDDDCLK